SPIDLRPKFMWYKPHLALITGIAWDHVNVFPTIDTYKEQFRMFIDSIVESGYLTWFSKDETLKHILSEHKGVLTTEPYDALTTKIVDGQTQVMHNGQTFEVPVFGSHNMQNMAGAMNLC